MTRDKKAKAKQNTKSQTLEKCVHDFNLLQERIKVYESLLDDSQDEELNMTYDRMLIKLLAQSKPLSEQILKYSDNVSIEEYTDIFKAYLGFLRTKKLIGKEDKECLSKLLGNLIPFLEQL